MGNMVYQIAPKHSVDSKIWMLQSLVKHLKDHNRKLTGAVKKKCVDHIRLHESEFLDDIDDIFLGDILEVTCTKQEYNLHGEEYEWPYVVNKPYQALVIYRYSSYNGYITVLLLDYANYKDKSNREDCYKLSEEIDFTRSDFESGVYKIRKLYEADQEGIELYGKRW